ncbi:hypothetical protein QSJ19_08690 [Gordonia sp. ABSL11-1]|uniref:hypothetical protein n=1 Tax=Gordonia sp. ABSL11-1 TaxID=3053924 RepID=UPI00257370B3|nr:hypothetical protein [Gordonia sp. ABSL11-1]MDL9945661.1 hypothetical protein [Gordonia sp. ABSL11-1]
MSHSRRAVDTRLTVLSAVAGAVCIATLAPTGSASAETVSVVDGLIADGTVYDVTGRDYDPDAGDIDFFDDLPGSATIVVTPGTDDTTLFPRIKPLITNRQALIVNYPQSFGPIIAGRSGKPFFLAPSYTDSKATAVEQNLKVMAAFATAGSDRPPMVVYTGYSQGADAVGDAAEKAIAAGVFDVDKGRVVLVSDPRSPWGIKAWLADMPLLPQVASVVGIDSDDARNPANTGAADVMSVIIAGDPAANFQWRWDRPVSSLIVDAAGFWTIHLGNGPQSYATLDRTDEATMYRSVEGNTRYAVYDVGHPLALLNQWAHDELGLSYTADDVARWNRDAEAFYPMQRPGVDNAAVKVKAAPSATPTGRYDVTVPSSVATGETSRSAASSSVPASPQQSSQQQSSQLKSVQQQSVQQQSVQQQSSTAVPSNTSTAPTTRAESPASEPTASLPTPPVPTAPDGASSHPPASESTGGSQSPTSESDSSDDPTSDESASDDGEDSSPDSGSDSSEG